MKEHQLRKGKAKCLEDSDSNDWTYICTVDDCLSIEPKFESGEAWLNHVRCVHDEPKWNLYSMRRGIEDAEQKERSNRLVDDVPGPSQKRVRVH